MNPYNNGLPVSSCLLLLFHTKTYQERAYYYHIAIMTETKDAKVAADTTNEPGSIATDQEPIQEPVTPKKAWYHSFLVFGSAAQIVTAAVLAIAIGLIVSTQADNVPTSAVELVHIPGDLWLRALKAVGMCLH